MCNGSLDIKFCHITAFFISKGPRSASIPPFIFRSKLSKLFPPRNISLTLTLSELLAPSHHPEHRGRPLHVRLPLDLVPRVRLHPLLDGVLPLGREVDHQPESRAEVQARPGEPNRHDLPHPAAHDHVHHPPGGELRR